MAERTNPFAAKKVGAADTKSNAKAKAAAARTENQVEHHTDAGEIPMNANGKPMVKIAMVASELIPTGQFANISVGPAQITAYIDPDNPEGFSETERENIANSLNQLAEIVEVDVIAVQRALILASMQDQLKEEAKA